MNVLAIGNSFSEDSTRYLHGIARADGVELQVANMYIGGCSLERHYRNMLSEEKAYELQYNGERTRFFVSMKEALLNRAWDVVTLQQASHLSFKQETYTPYLEELVKYVRKNVPKAKIYIHQTWAYESGSDRLLNMAKYDTPEGMLSDIVNAYDIAAQTINADGIIRSGELFAKLLQNGVPRVHRDTFHVTLGLGRYALGLLWYRTLCKRDIFDNGFFDFDELISTDDIDAVKKCVSQM